MLDPSTRSEVSNIKLSYAKQTVRTVHDSIFRKWHEGFKFAFGCSVELTIRVESDQYIIKDAKVAMSATSMVQNLWKMRNEATNTDVEWMANAGVAIPVHSVVISACSPVFAAMLSSDFVEARTGRIDLSRYSAEFLKEVVDYMYSEELPKNTDIVDLLKFADMYQMHHMRAACELKLIETLKKENLEDYAELVHCYELSELKKAIAAVERR